MTRFALRTAIVSAFVVGVSLAIFFGFLNHNRNLVVCTGCGLPRSVSFAKVSIPKGTSGSVIATEAMYSTKFVRWSQMVKVAVDPSEVHRRSHDPDHPCRSAADCRRLRAPRPALLPARLPQERSRLPDSGQDVPLPRASKLHFRPRRGPRRLGGRVALGSRYRRARCERNTGRLLPLRSSLPSPRSEDPVRNKVLADLTPLA